MRARGSGDWSSQVPGPPGGQDVGVAVGVRVATGVPGHTPDAMLTSSTHQPVPLRCG